MTEEQFEAMRELIVAIAYEQAGIAVHQRPSKYGVIEAVNAARAEFNLPPTEPEENEED